MSTAAPQGGSEPEEFTLSQIAEKYKNRWVAIEVTGRDGNSQPTKGKVVAQDVDRYRLRSSLARRGEVCIYYTGETPYPLLL
ncbi:MAG: hypothetical protein JRN33_06990 [Nitrososphaerota archaeon]|nr:hypothetical protein [Nitrososphaerota archaeon]